MKSKTARIANLKPYAFLVAIVYGSLWFGLGATRLWDRDEPRNARCAVEMLERNDWVVPYFNDRLRTHKPVLLYWMEMLAYQCFGENAFSARLPSAWMGSLAVAAVTLLATRFSGRSAGIWAGSALATCAMMVVASRAATPDASLVCTSCWGVTGLILHWKSGSQSRTVWWYVGYLSLGLAILAKGPVGIVLPSLVVGLWCVIQEYEHLAQNQCRPKLSRNKLLHRSLTAIGNFTHCIGISLRRLHVFSGVGLAILLASPWYVWVGMRTNGEWLNGFFWEHNISRAMHAMEGHRGGLWYYPAATMLGVFPWSLLLIPVVMWTWRTLKGNSFSTEHLGYEEVSESRVGSSDSLRQMSLLGVIWIGIYIGSFSIARTKLPSYITPCYPGAALLIGGFLSHWSTGIVHLTRRMIWAGGSAYAIAGVTMSAGLVYLSMQRSMDSVRYHAAWPLLFLAVAAAMLWAAFKGRQQWVPMVIVSSASILMAAVFGGVAAKIDMHRQDLNTMLSLDSNSNWLAVGTIEPSWVFYRRKPIEELSVDNSNLTASLQRVATHLESPHARLLVDQQQWNRIQEELSNSFGIHAEIETEFSPFLKNRVTLVVRKAATFDVFLSDRNSSNHR